MKPSELKRDARTTVTFSKEVKDLLKARGLSIQDIFNKAIDAELGDLKVETEEKSPEKTKRP